MYYAGLVSISFRDHSPEEITKNCAQRGLNFIEWGSDVHAPYEDAEKLQHIANLQQAYGISCCSYGTYFRLGYTPMEELSRYFTAAKILGTNILRLWAGRKKAEDCTEEERNFLFSQCKQAAALAEAQGIILCLECHRRSYTETADGALALMRHVNSPNFKIYWQPNPDISLDENLDYISALQDYITHIHVFNWISDHRLPLSEGISVWKQYLSHLSGDHCLLLEFMPDDQIRSLENEAKSLHKLIANV